MKKITFLLAFMSIALFSSAQVKITFDDAVIGSTGGATAMSNGGSVDVVANTYTTGNASTKALHVNNTNYLPVFFGNVAIPAGAETVYSKIRVKYLIIGGTDKDYPTLEVYSSPNSTTAGATEKIGEVGWSGLWSTAEIGVWKTVEFTFASATLKPVPAGFLVLKLAKSNTEYLIDDVELVPVPVATPVVTINDFESNALNDVLNMKRWSPTDASAIVEANPTIASNKSAHVVAVNWNSGIKQNVVLPAGKILANYDKLSFDIYLNNITGTDNLYKNVEVYVDGTKVIDTQSAGTANVWENKTYTLNNLAGANAFELVVGLNSNFANYYIDNIKLTEKSSATGLNETGIDAVQAYYTNNLIKLSRIVNQADVYNVDGRLLVSSKNTSEINVSGSGHGIYIVKTQLNGQILNLKVSK